jgi:predicted GIY-YIG superfamily endonuclease
MTARIYAVYILATRKDGPLYVGITNDLERVTRSRVCAAALRAAARTR